MKIKGTGDLRNPNPANPFREVEPEKQKVYYVDLDGTLAFFDRWGTIGDIGEPIPIMKKWVLYWISKGIKVKIFTARAYKKESIPFIKKWLILNGFPPNLDITNIKGIDCTRLFDNNAREVINNTGIIVDRLNEFNTKELKNTDEESNIK